MLTRFAGERKCAASERGFTLPEVMIVVVLLGILAAIAIPSWFGVIERRNVESAANQVASNLRFAHSSAINRLETWEFKVPASAGAAPVRTFTIGAAGATPKTRTLTEGSGTRFVTSSTNIAYDFCAKGSVQLPELPKCSSFPTSGNIDIRVASDDGSPFYTIRVRSQTSGVTVCEGSC